MAALLSFRLFLLNVADTIPRTSDHVPLLGEAMCDAVRLIIEMCMDAKNECNCCSIVVFAIVVGVVFVARRRRRCPRRRRRRCLYHGYFGKAFCSTRYVSLCKFGGITRRLQFQSYAIPHLTIDTKHCFYDYKWLHEPKLNALTDWCRSTSMFYWPHAEKLCDTLRMSWKGVLIFTIRVCHCRYLPVVHDGNN